MWNTKMIRSLLISDYDAIIRLWTEMDGVGTNSLDDSEEGIRKYLNRNPNTCFVFEIENNVVGTILTGHDGRRGYIYHLAVQKKYQGNKIGNMLVEKAIEALKNEGITKIALVVFVNNTGANDFWEKMGFISRNDIEYRNKRIITYK